MKRYGYLYEKVIDIDNCKKAILEAARHKHKRSYVSIVVDNLDEYANDLSIRLQTLKITSPYRLKEIEDGLSHKRRVIKVPKFYPDQCAHHAVMQVLYPIIMKSAYRYSCANIPNRGIDYASKYMTKCTKLHKLKYCSKLDIKKFYPSMPNDKLKAFIRTKVKDKRVLDMLDAIIDTSEGLPIGNYTSPWFAEWYLQRLDHYIKEQLKVPFYCRYADDMVLMSNNKKKLQSATRKIIAYVDEELGLKIKDNYQVFPICSRKIDFIGRCYGIGHTTIRKRRALALMRQSRLIQKLQHKDVPLCFHLCCGFISRIGIFKYTNSYAMKCKYQYSVNVNQLKDVVRRNYEKSRCIEETPF